MNSFLLAAAITSFLTNLIHIFLGGKYVARPLLDANGLTKAAKYTNYYCWHLTTITLFAIALAFLNHGVLYLGLNLSTKL